MRIYFNKKFVVLLIAVIIFLTYATFLFDFKSPNSGENEEELNKLTKIIELKSRNLDENESLLHKLQQQFGDIVKDSHHATRFSMLSKKKTDEEQNPYASKHHSTVISNITIPVVVFAFNRPSVSRCLDLLFKYRNVAGVNFPVVVSRDGDDVKTANVIDSYGDKFDQIQGSTANGALQQLFNFMLCLCHLGAEYQDVLRGVKTFDETQRALTHFHHPAEKIDVSPKHHRYVGYYKISSHYKWALSKTFEHFPSAKTIIIVEDDLEVSPDFFKYFFATYHLLLQDPTLYCVSAWNDNGKKSLIDEHAASLLYRTDFFPGLGWMITRSTWREMAVKWPASFWDDWIRDPAQRRDRSCIRPEIPRTKTFGRIGVSNGQFYDQHLKFIKLNEEDVNWQRHDLAYLAKESYDKEFIQKVLDLPEITISDLQSSSASNQKVKITYTNAASFKGLAKVLGIMDDFKAGVPRMSYRGIVSVFYRGTRVYLIPAQPWNGYDVNWS